MSSYKMEENLFIFWAKTSHDKEKFPNAYHPLLCHMIDVAAVARMMWDEVLPQAARNRIAETLGIPIKIAGKVISWIAGLHDLGKASPPFALREAANYLYTLYENSPFRKPPSLASASEAPHGYVTAETLPQILQSHFQLHYDLAERIGIVIGGHHGVFPRSKELTNLEAKIGNKAWKHARTGLAVALAKALDLPEPLNLPATTSLDNATSMFLAGLVSVADWIGSNSTYFPCRVDNVNQSSEIDANDYLKYAQKQAHRALAEMGWLNWPNTEEARSFAEMFPSLKGFPMRTVQEAAVNIANALDAPGIVVIEAPMGEGKTEAAMYLADHWNVKLKHRGVYFALPTQATSNQMFGRVKKFLESRFVDNSILLQLLHGHASLSAEFETLLKQGAQALKLNSVCDDEASLDHQCMGGVVAAEWFTHRKRGLLTPFGVGTVDQALMAVLQTRHVFVRLFGLAHKTVIIDEIHAYDAYMSTLLERLLEWLAALGSPVVLLSATLPQQRRMTLLNAYARGLNKEELPTQDGSTHYPGIIWLTKNSCGSEAVETSPQNSRTLQLRWMDGRLPEFEDGVFKIGDVLREYLVSGGCAAVICNTVDRAQQVYEKLRLLFPGKASDGHDLVDLLHARFLFKDRAKREQRTLIRFGKPGEEVHRPDCAILVSTQIIEQSLDLDFDLIITDIAPVDLLLQRSGREWRHERLRPDKITQPVLWICQPDEASDGVPDFGLNGFIYDEHILLRSWLALKTRGEIRIPGDVEELIEAVYDNERDCPVEHGEQVREFWKQTRTKMIEKRERKEAKAAGFRILPPHYKDFFEDFNLELEEDSPKYHRSLQAQTRDDDTPSLSVIFLKPNERHLLMSKPSIATIRQLLERSVNIVKRGAVERLIDQEPPDEWKDSPLLRHHRLIEVDERGGKQIGDYLFRVHPDLGIVIETSERRKADG